MSAATAREHRANSDRCERTKPQVCFVACACAVATSDACRGFSSSRLLAVGHRHTARRFDKTKFVLVAREITPSMSSLFTQEPRRTPSDGSKRGSPIYCSGKLTGLKKCNITGRDARDIALRAACRVMRSVDSPFTLDSRSPGETLDGDLPLPCFKW